MRSFRAAAILFVTIPLAGVCVSHAQTPAAKRSCTVDQREPDAGDKALAREDFAAAEAFYRDALKADAKLLEAHLGLVRALLGRDDIAAARTEAAQLHSLGPESAIAEIAAANVGYRAAELDDAQDHIVAAMQHDPCDGRALAAAAQLVTLNAMYAQAARYLAAAHKLRPNDELIRREWIATLTNDQRTAELERYLGSKPSLSASDHRDLNIALQLLKVHRPGECHITAANDHIKIPYQLVSANNLLFAEAFGLDVEINGQHRNMEIDTGASGITLTPDAAKKLNLKPERTLLVVGVGDEGMVESYLTHVSKIQIGDVLLEDCTVEVLAKGDLHSDGLIGLDVFSHWLTTLDYRKRELRLDPLPQRPNGPATATGVDDDMPRDRFIAPQMADWLHILRIGHMLLLPARLNKGPTRYLLADSGATTTSFSPLFAKDGGKLHPEYDTKIKGLNGYVRDVFRVEQVRLQFGPLGYPTRNYLVFDITSLSHNAEFEISGFYGLHDLLGTEFVIDYRDNLAKLTDRTF
jgi:predicted aspartyl protease